MTEELAVEERLAERRGVERPPLSPEALRSLGLTTRESEVLTWVALGKTNPEVGTILGARPRTVAKHLERIFVKLGVETRTAAAARAHAAADTPATESRAGTPDYA